MYLRLGDIQKTENAYLQARELAPTFAAAYVNLADLYRLQQRKDQVVATLTEAHRAAADNAEVEHALGLYYVRNQHVEKALESLARSVRLIPGNARYSYVYGVALYSNGDSDRAISVLEQVHGKTPYDRDTLMALVSYHKGLGNIPEASAYAHKLVELDPRYGSVEQIMR